MRPHHSPGGATGSASKITQTVVVLQMIHPSEVSLNVFDIVNG